MRRALHAGHTPRSWQEKATDKSCPLGPQRARAESHAPAVELAKVRERTHSTGGRVNAGLVIPGRTNTSLQSVAPARAMYVEAHRRSDQQLLPRAIDHHYLERMLDLVARCHLPFIGSDVELQRRPPFGQ